MIFADVFFVGEMPDETGEKQEPMWKDAYLESRVMSASPLELVTILYEHAIQAVEDARWNLAEKDINGRAKAITKAISIISELHGSLDHAAGGDFSQRLAALYNYMKSRLTTANLQQKDEPLAEVLGLLKTLAEGWNTISREESGGQGSAGEQFAASDSMHFLMQGDVRESAGGWSA